MKLDHETLQRKAMVPTLLLPQRELVSSSHSVECRSPENKGIVLRKNKYSPMQGTPFGLSKPDLGQRPNQICSLPSGCFGVLDVGYSPIQKELNLKSNPNHQVNVT